ncbi:L-tyrosine/L-tryptophan isonitrile synthase family protein [Nocardia jiangsuensis]|uniref:L-tyrosine/L-tryptophan isonitrile synthase family protein n=1 Tax=Nocardia jiangsuensis TaxID=1691563 RepID=A0ABV8DP09_9NOCA
MAAAMSVETDIPRKVLEFLHRYQRVHQSGEGVPTTTDRIAEAYENRKSKIDHFVRRNESIHFVIPAFPAKSPNRNKVLGSTPDLGENIALGFLQSLCDYVGHFYSPGARITICSDGHVFGDVVGVSDILVTEYRDEIEKLVATAGWMSLDMFGLDDAFGSQDYPKLRDVLECDYSDSLAELKESVRTDAATRALFDGIHRFMFEDAMSTCEADVSRTKIRNQSKASAYQTIRRSNAWSRVVSEHFPDAVRLSIHPQPPHSEKFGLHLVGTGDSWLTPWHGVVLDDGVRRRLVKRWEAEELGATMVSRHNRPSHFVAPQIAADSREEISA